MKSCFTRSKKIEKQKVYKCKIFVFLTKNVKTIIKTLFNTFYKMHKNTLKNWKTTEKFQKIKENREEKKIIKVKYLYFLQKVT